ncbi:MAG TPA: diaminopimelate decarboxylase, partial [Candidatus Obscuribacterales bacterium]
MSKAIISPNTSIMPVTAITNMSGHLTVGGCDTVTLAQNFGTPLWIIDEETIRQAATACMEGLSVYPGARALYAGKAFLCLAMCYIVRQLGMGIDVVSEGELYTARESGFPGNLIYMHGNNKSEREIRDAIQTDGVTIVIDNLSELWMCAAAARSMQKQAKILLRVTPGVEPDTHHYIKTGHAASKFGLSLDDIPKAINFIAAQGEDLKFEGLHAHIGSQSKEIEPFLEIVDIMAELYEDIRKTYGISLPKLDLGGGLGISYTEPDNPVGIFEWARQIATRALSAFKGRQLPLPELLVEPGRAIIGTAGVTVYRAGHIKTLPDGKRLIAVDGGMADNPRPMT